MAFTKKFTIKLTDTAFKRVDEQPDEQFYRIPRFTAHIDGGAIHAVTTLYRQYFGENTHILDLMSSWLSHLPEDISYQQVVGLGLNEREMARNKQLDDWVVQNLNTQPLLPFEDNHFDGVAICVSIDYLIQPVTVLKEVGRVLKPEAPLVITFSNRYFETKATAAWLALNEEQRVYFVKSLVDEAAVFDDVEMMDCSPEVGDPLYAVVARAIS